MGRKTFRKVITSKEISEQINPKNRNLINRFLKEKNTRCSDTTITNYKSDLEIFFTWNYLENDDKFFIKIRKLELADFFAYCVEDLKWGSSRFARMRSCLSSLSEFIEKFYDEDYPEFRNIVLKAIESMPKAERRKKTVLSKEQVDNLLNYLSNELNNPQEACLLALAISSGARKSELLRFDIDLIDENNTAFDDLFIETKEPIKTKGRTKEGKLLYKYIYKKTFIDYYKTWLPIRKKIMEENGVEEHNKLFIRRDGQPIQVAGVDRWIEKWEKYLEVPIYMHCFRHYLVTELTRIGLEQGFIVELYGWDSQEMYNTYCDITAKDKKWKNLDKLK